MGLFKVAAIDIWWRQILQNLGFSQIDLTAFYSYSQSAIAFITKVSFEE